MREPEIKEIMSLLKDHDTSRFAKPNVFHSSFEQWAAISMLSWFVLAILAAIASRFFPDSLLPSIAMLFVVFSQASAAAQIVAATLSLSAVVRRPTEALVSRLVDSQANDFAAVGLLSQFEEAALVFVRERLRLEVQQFGERSRMILGAIQNVGWIPAVVASAISLQSQWFTPQFPTGLAFWFAIVWAGIGGLSALGLTTAQRLDAQILILELAIERKKAAGDTDPSPPGDG